MRRHSARQITRSIDRSERPTVLIVDDGCSGVSSLSNWLDGRCRVLTAADSSAAVEQVDDRVDVVLLARETPTPTGIVTEEIRSRGFHSRVALVTNPDSSKKLAALGFDDYLLWPLNRSELVDAVDRLARRAAFGKCLDRSYALARRAAELETALSDEALANNDQYAAVTDEFDSVERRLDELSRQFTAGDYRAEIVSLGFCTN